jgi:hypothetical protein
MRGKSMPIHDWTKVAAAIFHDFKSYWVQVLKHILNDGLLPGDYYAISERANVQSKAIFPHKWSRLTVRQVDGDKVVAVIEILSPWNTQSKDAINAFVSDAVDLLTKRIHLLLIDLFPGTPCDSPGIIASIHQELFGTVLELPPTKPLTLAAYEADPPLNFYGDPVAISDELPDMPLFLIPGMYINVPLEKTYLKAWEGVPARWRKVIEPQSP